MDGILKIHHDVWSLFPDLSCLHQVHLTLFNKKSKHLIDKQSQDKTVHNMTKVMGNDPKNAAEVNQKRCTGHYCQGVNELLQWRASLSEHRNIFVLTRMKQSL